MALGIDDVLVGCWTDDELATGVTVILPPQGSQGVAVVRGGAPGTRELAALGPFASGRECHAVVLCGSSVFGLAAADGVAEWCAETGRGLDLGGAIIPVVAAAVVFDIKGVGHARPGPRAGIDACDAASCEDPDMGPVGVGRGCTVGKHAGRNFSQPGGQGWAVMAHGDLVVGALVAANGFGDVVSADGRVLAGSTAPPDRLRYPYASLEQVAAWGEGRANTTIGCIVTNALLTKPEATRATDLAHHGIARAVRPSHTDVDGDALFMLSTGTVEASADLVAEMAGEAVASAIRSAVDPHRR
ncbi:MAG: P1 family peptidase [Actinomycetia bacterium]|nr:P1 family peptidase [Actinomycetes bacterium]